MWQRSKHGEHGFIALISVVGLMFFYLFLAAEDVKVRVFVMLSGFFPKDSDGLLNVGVRVCINIYVFFLLISKTL